MMLVGMSLFWVGAVLFLNGLWVLNKVGDREIAVIDVFVGTLTLGVAIYLAFGPGANASSIKGAAFLLLFTFTYYWVAWNRWNGADGRGLGWFCFFVAITCAPIAIQSFLTAHTVWDYWLAFCWLSWGVLWFLFYLLLAAGRTELTKFTGTLCTLQGIYTGWIPGYLLLIGAMPGGPVPTH
jgi:putative amide transporter protein